MLWDPEGPPPSSPRMMSGARGGGGGVEEDDRREIFTDLQHFSHDMLGVHSVKHAGEHKLSFFSLWLSISHTFTCS